jgi:hypothetical protein
MLNAWTMDMFVLDCEFFYVVNFLLYAPVSYLCMNYKQLMFVKIFVIFLADLS